MPVMSTGLKYKWTFCQFNSISAGRVSLFDRADMSFLTPILGSMFGYMENPEIVISNRIESYLIFNKNGYSGIKLRNE